MKELRCQLTLFIPTGLTRVLAPSQVPTVVP